MNQTQHKDEGQGRRSLAHRLWQYQKERFPLMAHGPLVFLFSFLYVSFDTLAQGHQAGVSPDMAAVAFICTLAFFALLRILDEFKDYEEDCRHRPYRAVPRGLVTLGELKRVLAFTMAMQAGLTIYFHISSAPWLILTWLYLGLMAKEFFVPKWLVKHPFIYALSHMVIMPLIALFSLSLGGAELSTLEPVTTAGLLGTAFFIGLVIEIGRKLRGMKEEEDGVVTYTSILGVPKAMILWLTCIAGSTVAALSVSSKIDFFQPTLWTLVPLLGFAVIVALFGIAKRDDKFSKMAELYSGIWTMALLAIVGLVPWLVKMKWDN